jgi:hypothetical protein
MPAMKVRAFLADSVESVEGKLYALGLGWNRLAAGGFPARHSRVGIGVLITLDAAESGEHNVELSLDGPDSHPVTLFTDPSGTEQVTINATFNTQSMTGPGEAVVPLALNIDGVSLPTAGAYAFSIRLDGNEVERLPFRVDQAGQAPPAGTPATTTARSRTEAGYL